MVTNERSAISPPAPRSRQGFQDIDTLRNSDGLTAVISQRRKSGELTFGIFRQWDNAGTSERTSFVPERMGAAYLDMVGMAIKRMAELRKAGNLPFGNPP